MSRPPFEKTPLRDENDLEARDPIRLLRLKLAEAESEHRKGREHEALQMFSDTAFGYSQHGMSAQALAVMVRALQIREEPQLRVLAARFCMEMRSKVDALRHLEAARRILMARQDHNALEQVLRQMIFINPNHPGTLEQLGRLLQLQGQEQLGRRFLDRAAKLTEHLAYMAAGDQGPTTAFTHRAEEEASELRAGLLGEVGLRSTSVPSGWQAASDEGQARRHDLDLDDFVRGFDFDIDVSEE